MEVALEIPVDPLDDPKVLRVLLEFQVDLYAWYTSEWVALAPQLVGEPLAYVLRELPDNVCLKEHFGAPDGPPWPQILSDLLDMRRDYIRAASAYDQGLVLFNFALANLRVVRTELNEFIAVFDLDLDLHELFCRTGRLLYASLRYSDAVETLLPLSRYRSLLQSRLAGLFDVGHVLTERMLREEEEARLQAIVQLP